MPKSMMAPPEVARRGPDSRKQKKPKISRAPNAVGANGVAGGSHLPPARARGGRNLWPMTPAKG